ncbi:MAG: hypothetical protein SH856_03490 [Flavobacteriales bacterium]|nr:hypothetical protein [Flavobacteriales bacterium]
MLSIRDKSDLEKLLKYVKRLKTGKTKSRGNMNAAMKSFGTIDDQSALEMKQIVDREFNHIEGEW